MNYLMKFSLAYVFNHPYLAEIDIVVVVEDGRFSIVLVRTLFGDRQYFFGGSVENVIVVARPQLYLLDLSLHIIYAVALRSQKNQRKLQLQKPN